jgi:hypothetical protein
VAKLERYNDHNRFASKIRNMMVPAPKARKYESHGQALSEAKRVAPWIRSEKLESTESAKYEYYATSYSALSELEKLVAISQGRHASLRSALAPGFHISRLWRSNGLLRHSPAF